jgi:hypothetical protein
MQLLNFLACYAALVSARPSKKRACLTLSRALFRKTIARATSDGMSFLGTTPSRSAITVLRSRIKPKIYLVFLIWVLPVTEGGTKPSSLRRKTGLRIL